MPNIISENLAKTEVLRSIHASSQARLGQLSIALASQSQMRNVRCWPIREVAARLIDVRLVGHGRLDLLTLSSSHFDPERTS